MQSDLEEAQEEVHSFLKSGVAFEGVAPELLVTHGNRLFLTKTRVYKMKRAVDFGWMDFSTLAKREAACRQELALNRRTAPDLYLGVEPVTREADGRLAVKGQGEPLEWLVCMRRFHQADRLDRLLESGQLTDVNLRRLADDLAVFHATAEPTPARGGVALARKVTAENAADLARAPTVFDAEAVAALTDKTTAFFDRYGPLADARAETGQTRRCHGDLHLANIVMWEGRALPFDCIEFNEAFSAIDPLYDLAFLLMDLEQRGRRDLANLVLNRWLALSDPPFAELPGLALLPGFLSLRAAIRAKVTGLEWLDPKRSDHTDLARRGQAYLDLALRYLEPPNPCLVAVGGLSGSGKSTLAQALAPDLGAAPGALVLRSDVLRKRLFGVMPEEHLPPEAYSPAWHERVQAALLEQAETALRSGQAVVLDAVQSDARVRAEVADLGHRLGLPAQGIWLEAPLDILQARVTARSGDASDATAAVVAKQAEDCQVPEDWIRLDARGTPKAVLAAARQRLGC
ncbi:MAG: AAA family ATPase [Pseudomonadota bacterium]